MTPQLSGIRVICLGGEVAEPPGMLFGSETVENAAIYRVDKMFFSTGGLSADGLISSGIYDLMPRAVAKNAEEVFYPVDRKKIDQLFHNVYGDLSEVDCVISDYDFSDEIKYKYSKTRFVTADRNE